MRDLDSVATQAAAQGERHALREGMHLVTPRRWYIHHGIYVGDGWVVHYAGFKSFLRRGPVEFTTLEAFGAGHGFGVAAVEGDRFSSAEIVQRACSRLGEDTYHLLHNNCEHFCTWCLYGKPRSTQVERLVQGPLYALLVAICQLNPLPGSARTPSAY